MLIVLSGLPGTGKSAVADGIARALRVPVLSVDPIESAILRAGIAQRFETGLAAYLVAQTLADRYMADGLDLVIDAVNSVEQARAMWRTLARKHPGDQAAPGCPPRSEAPGAGGRQRADPGRQRRGENLDEDRG